MNERGTSTTSWGERFVRARGARGALAAASALAVAAACSTGADSSSAPAPTSTSPSAPSGSASLAANRVTLARGVHPLARPEYDLGRVDAGKVLHNLSLVFKMSDAQKAERDALLEEIIRQRDVS